MADPDSDRQNRRFDIDESTQPDLITSEEAAPRSADRILVLGYKAKITGA